MVTREARSGRVDSGSSPLRVGVGSGTRSAGGALRRLVFAPVCLLLPLSACGRIKATEELAAPAVAQGLYLGLDLPDGIELDPDSDLLAYTAACTVFLAYVSDPAALADSPLEGADVSFRSAENDPLPMHEEGGGEYLVTAGEGLVYVPDDTALVNFVVDGEDAQMSVTTPSAPDITLDPVMTPLEGFTIDATGQGYDNLIVAVYDVRRNKITWDNLPESVGETYEYTHAPDAIETVDVPGEALPGEASFLIGVAGMELADPNGFTGLNQTLSAFMAGQFSLYYVLTQAD